LYETVDSIIKDVCSRGDSAVHEYSQKFDQVDVQSTKVAQSEIDKALASFDEQTLKDSKFAIEQVRNFAQAQFDTMQSLDIETLDGVHLGHALFPLILLAVMYRAVVTPFTQLPLCQLFLLR
tara:strand:+ start:560 stop:925 length:366 start_codon:yes stop_codon:yes gene_type:complete